MNDLKEAVLPQLTENIDYYYNENGYMVLTEKYLKNRGYCCGNGCKHCPFDYENVPEPMRSELLQQKQKNASV